MLGDFYTIGIARPRSFSRARELFERAADVEHPSARTRYGLFLEWWNCNIATSRQTAFDYMPYLTGSDPESLYRLGNVLEPPKIAELTKCMKERRLAHFDMEGCFRCYRDAALLGSLEAFRRMLHVLRQLGNHAVIIDTYLFQYLCLPERAIAQKVREILPRDHLHYAIAAKVFQQIKLPCVQVETDHTETKPEKRAKDLRESIRIVQLKDERRHEIACDFFELESLYTKYEDLPFFRTDSQGQRHEYRGAHAIDFLYRWGIDLLSRDGHSLNGMPTSTRYSLPKEYTHKRAMKPTVLRYAKWLKTQGRRAEMFAQYHRAAQPPKSAKLAIYKTGKYLLRPKHGECVPNHKLGIEFLMKAQRKGIARAPFHIGRYQIEHGKLDEGLDNLILSFRMGHVPGLFSYVDCVNKMGGSRRDASQHFTMLLDAYRGLTRALQDNVTDMKRSTAERDFKASLERLSSVQYVKYQWREGIRLLPLSPSAARMFFEMAKENGHPGAPRLWAPARTHFSEHSEKGHDTFEPFAKYVDPCRICGKNEVLLKMKCSKCEFRVCQLCVGGIYVDST
jgi:TPR repeat protein